MRGKNKILSTWTEYIVAVNNFGRMFKKRFNLSDECIQNIKYKVNQVVEEELMKEGVLK